MTGDLAIKTNIQYLHKYLLGEQLALNDPEILATYNLLVDSNNALRAAAPGTDLGDCASNTISTDANYMVRSWQAVIMYLLEDYKFIVE